MKRKKKIAGWSITQERVVILRNWNDQEELNNDDREDGTNYASIAYYKNPSARTRWSNAIRGMWDKYRKARQKHHFWATIGKQDPRSQHWQPVFGSTTIPIQSPIPQKANLPGYDTPQTVYMLALHALDYDIVNRIIEHIANQFNLPYETVQHQLYTKGVPLLAQNLTITITDPHNWF